MTKYEAYIDIENFQSSAQGTIPPSFYVTAERPDIVIIDKAKKIINVFELTCPFETRINGGGCDGGPPKCRIYNKY